MVFGTKQPAIVRRADRPWGPADGSPGSRDQLSVSTNEHVSPDEELEPDLEA